MTEGSNGLNSEQLLSVIERVESVEATIRQEQQSRKDIYSEAKSNGFDPKIIRKIVAARKRAEAARREENELLALYSDAIGQGDLFA